MSGGYQVSPKELTEHASRVAAIAGSIEKAAEAAKSEGVLGSGNPFGIFSQLIVPTQGTLASAVAGYIANLADSTQQMSKALKDNADMYQALDDDMAVQIGKLLT